MIVTMGHFLRAHSARSIYYHVIIHVSVVFSTCFLWHIGPNDIYRGLTIIKQDFSLEFNISHTAIVIRALMTRSWSKFKRTVFRMHRLVYQCPCKL